MKKLLLKAFFPIKWLFAKINGWIYDLRVLVHSRVRKNNAKDERKIGKNYNKTLDLIFYCGFLAVPLVMFILTNIVINGNAIVLAFQKYEGNKIVFAGFENFITLFNNFFYDVAYQDMLWRSLLIYAVTTVIGTTVPIVFSYYVYKKLFGHKLFKIMLFIPTILSSIITVSMFKMVANEVIPAVWLKLTGNQISPLLNDPGTTFQTILFYTVWMGLGGGLLTQLAAMNTVDPSVTESAQLEGIGFFQELWHIVLPACYEVLALGFITGIAGIFTNTLNLYSFFGSGAPATTNNLGYFFQLRTIEAEMMDYPYLSAWGVTITLIATPLTLLLRHVINKYGPSEDTHEKKKHRA